MRSLLVSAALVFSAGCPSSSAKKEAAPDLEGFECDSRSIEYMVTGGFVADEAGVSVLCDGDVPRLEKWRLEEGERKSETYPLNAEQFNRIWRRIDTTGWRHAEDECENPGAADADPFYAIDVSDHALSRSFTCQGKELPHPYDKMINEIDLLAASVE